MRRFYPFLLLVALLLFACDSAVSTPTTIVQPSATAAAVIATSTTAAAAATPTMAVAIASPTSASVAAGADSAELRRYTVPAVGTAAINDGFASTSPDGAELAEGFSASQAMLPKLSAPALKVNLPALPQTAGRMSLSSVGAPENWQILLDEDFSAPIAADWNTGTGEGGTTELIDGELRITAEEGWQLMAYPRQGRNMTDGYIAATFTYEGDGDGGVIVRSSGNGNAAKSYICLTYSAGQFSCFKRLDGEWILIASGDNEAILPGEPNTLALQAVGTDILFSVNDSVVYEFSDADAARGTFGVFAESRSDTTVAHFSHVQLAKPGAAAASPTTEVVATATEEVAATATEEVQATATRTVRTTRTPRTTATATTTATARVSPVLTLPPHATATTTAVATGNTIVDDDFEDGDAVGWTTIDQDGFFVGANEGALQVRIDDGGSMLISRSLDAGSLDDASISTDVTIDGDGYAGTIGRFTKGSSNEWNVYYCLINNEGRFACGKFVDDQSTNLSTGRSAAINKNGSNNIVMSAEGSTIQFSINGRRAVSFADEDLSSGTWGVVAESGTEAITASFDRITITAP